MQPPNLLLQLPVDIDVASTKANGAMTASMYYSVLKVLVTFQTSSLPVQSTLYSMDLFYASDDTTPVDGMAIWLLKLRFES